VEQLRHSYDIRLDLPGHVTLEEVLREKLAAGPERGDTLELGHVTLHAREISEDGRVISVGLVLSP